MNTRNILSCCWRSDKAHNGAATAVSRCEAPSIGRSEGTSFVLISPGIHYITREYSEGEQLRMSGKEVRFHRSTSRASGDQLNLAYIHKGDAAEEEG